MAEIRLLIEINSVIYNLDLPKGEAIKINYSIAATSNPTKRTGSFSRDIKLPATKHNIKTLGFLHELNDFDTKDVTNRKTAWIEVDGNIFIKGYMRADAIYRNFKIRYFRVRVFGDNIDIKDLLSAQTLNTLDFGQITLNAAACEATWAHTDSDDGDFVFPLINYGKWNGTTNGYDYVTAGDLAPAIFLRPLIINMFNAVGYNVISSWLDTSLAKKLIVPYTNKKGYVHSDAWQNGLKYKVENTGTQTIAAGAIDTTVLFQNEQYDNGNDFASNTYTAPVNGYQKFVFDGSIVMGGGILFVNWLQIVRTSDNTVVAEFTLHGNTTNNITLTSDWVRVYAGNTFLCRVTQGNAMTVNTTAYFYNIPRPEILEGDTVDVGGIMRDDLSLWQLFEGLVGCFNLYMLTNTLSKDVIIEPRDDFFNPITSAVDWTNKLDVNTISDEVITDPNQELTYGYKKDSNDKLMARWEKDEDKLLGDYDYDMPERFKVGKKRIGTKLFAPTYMGYDFRICALTYGGALVGLIDHDLKRNPLIPYMWADLPSGNFNSGEYPDKSYKFAPRLLLWLGDSTELTRDGELPKFWWWNGSTITTRYQYPKAVSYNNDDISNGNLLYADRWDNGTQIKGLFSSYFYNELQARIRGIKRTAKVYVTEKDIMMLANCANVSGQLDFRNLIFLKIDNGNYWILSAIKDYEVGTKKLTTCEFIRWTATEAAPEQPIEVREVGGGISMGTIPDLINEGLGTGTVVAGNLIWTSDGSIVVSDGGGFVNPVQKGGHPG